MFRLPDSRSDLGIARLGKTPRIHDMVGSNSWPYTDDYEEFSYSDKEKETKEIIDKKQISPINDYGDISGVDRSALHDIIKVEAVAKGLSPFPDMYKNREGHFPEHLQTNMFGAKNLFQKLEKENKFNFS